MVDECIFCKIAMKEIPAKIVYEDQDINVTMSFGLAAFPVGGSITREELVKSSDAALYRAKEQGRNRCCCSECRQLKSILFPSGLGKNR